VAVTEHQRTAVALVKLARDPAIPGGLDAAGQIAAEESFPMIEPSAAAGLTLAREAVGPSGTVLVVSLGGPEVETVLRRSLELGADHAVRVDVARWRHLSAEEVAACLVRAIRRAVDQPDLVVCGDRSIDEGGGEVGPRVAHALGLRWATGVASASVSEDGNLTLRQRRPRGERLVVSAALPAVICMDPTPVPPEPVAAPIAIAAATAPIEVIAIPPAARRTAPRLQRLRPRVLPLSIPRQDLPPSQRIWSMFWGGETAREGTVLALPADETARRILDLLEQRGLLS
jgi:electron transfer flavoprotein alpha/beta subunit